MENNDVFYLPPRMWSLKGLLRSLAVSLVSPVSLSPCSPGSGPGPAGTILEGSGRPRPALSRRGREFVWLERKRSFRGRESLQFAALPWPPWPPGSAQFETPDLGTLASRLKGIRPLSAPPPPRLLRVLARKTSSSICWPSARPRLLLLMVARPLVRLVMVWNWALVTEPSLVLGGTAGGILTWPGAAGGCDPGWPLFILCGSTGLSWASCDAVTLLVLRVPVLFAAHPPGWNMVRGYSLWWTILRFYVRQTVYFIWTRDQFWNQFSLILGLTHYQDRGSVRKVV